MWILTRNRDKVCRERAEEFVKKKYGPRMEELRHRHAATRDPRAYSELLMVSREAEDQKKKMYEHYLKNYEFAADSYKDKEMAQKMGVKEFTNYLIEELNKI